MAGNPKTSKSVAPKKGQEKATGYKGGKNQGAMLPGNKTQSTASVSKKKK
jgi:hypothetical protein